ncbi:MAG: hypothetical protein HZA01_07630 [Nitrospinae bacterium]|nr:hypothetical protein [Nitrospinota bacterium]
MPSKRALKSGVFPALVLFFLCAHLLCPLAGRASPASASENPPPNQSPRTPSGAEKIDSILQRSSSLGSLSGFADIKIHSPKIKKSFKAAILLQGGENARIDGLSPFGAPVFNLVYIRNNLLVHFPSSGAVYLDYVETEGLFHLLDFPSTGYSLIELVSGSLLSQRTRGEATLKGTAGGDGFLLSVTSPDDGEPCEVKLDSALLPKQADFLKKGGRRISIVYSDYEPTGDGVQFPRHSILQVKKEDISVEFFFKSVDIHKELSPSSFRVPVDPEFIFIDREDLLEQLK